MVTVGARTGVGWGVGWCANHFHSTSSAPAVTHAERKAFRSIPWSANFFGWFRVNPFLAQLSRNANPAACLPVLCAWWIN